MADADGHGMRARRSALEGVMAPGLYGAGDFRGPGVVLSHRHPVSMRQIEARPEQCAGMLDAVQAALGARPDETPNRSAGDERLRFLWTGPNRWLAVAADGDAAFEGLDAALAPTGAAVVDLSHGRTIVRLSGRSARSVLMKGGSLDWHPDAFVPDRCAQTALFHVSALIDCRDRDVFDLYVARGLARTFWHHLTDAAAEYGYQVIAG